MREGGGQCLVPCLFRPSNVHELGDVSSDLLPTCAAEQGSMSRGLQRPSTPLTHFTKDRQENGRQALRSLFLRSEVTLNKHVQLQ